MSARIGMLVALAACGRVNFDPRDARAIAHRKPITIMPDAGTLTDFPVGVLIAADAELAAGARPDGRDLEFTAADGTTPLAFEIERYDGAVGALVAWVRVPTLAGTTQLYLYYGGDTLDAQDAPGTWPGCLGVWHLGDDGASRDSTSYAHLLEVPAGFQQPASILGIAGAARSFNGIDTSLQVADPPDGSLDMGLRSYSISLWVHVTQSAGLFDTPLYKGGGAAPDAGYDIEIGSSQWRTDVGDGTNQNYATFGFQPMFLGAWTHLVGVADRDAQRLNAYVDGTFRNALDITPIGSVDSAHPLEISGDAEPFDGIIDEIRIYDHALSAAWIAAEYRNLADPASFVSIGAEELPP